MFQVSQNFSKVQCLPGPQSHTSALIRPDECSLGGSHTLTFSIGYTPSTSFGEERHGPILAFFTRKRKDHRLDTRYPSSTSSSCLATVIAPLELRRTQSATFISSLTRLLQTSKHTAKTQLPKMWQFCFLHPPLPRRVAFPCFVTA